MLTLLCASESREEGICSQGNDDVIDLLRGKAAEQVAQLLRIRCDPRRGTSSVPKGQSFAIRQNDVPGLPVSVSPPLLNDLQEQRVWKLEQRHVEQPGVVLCLFIHRRWQRGASPFGFRKIVIPSSSLSLSIRYSIIAISPRAVIIIADITHPALTEFHDALTTACGAVKCWMSCLCSVQNRRRLVQGGETNTVELKVAAPRATEMAERLCGMANAQGGVVLCEHLPIWPIRCSLCTVLFPGFHRYCSSFLRWRICYRLAYVSAILPPRLSATSAT